MGDVARVVCDLRVPCPRCAGGGIRLLVCLEADEIMHRFSFMHSEPDCKESDELGIEDLFVEVEKMIAHLRQRQSDA